MSEPAEPARAREINPGVFNSAGSPVVTVREPTARELVTTIAEAARQLMRNGETPWPCPGISKPACVECDGEGRQRMRVSGMELITKCPCRPIYPEDAEALIVNPRKGIEMRGRDHPRQAYLGGKQPPIRWRNRAEIEAALEDHGTAAEPLRTIPLYQP